MDINITNISNSQKIFPDNLERELNGLMICTEKLVEFILIKSDFNLIEYLRKHYKSWITILYLTPSMKLKFFQQFIMALQKISNNEDKEFLDDLFQEFEAKFNIIKIIVNINLNTFPNEFPNEIIENPIKPFLETARDKFFFTSFVYLNKFYSIYKLKFWTIFEENVSDVKELEDDNLFELNLNNPIIEKNPPSDIMDSFFLDLITELRNISNLNYIFAGYHRIYNTIQSDTDRIGNTSLIGFDYKYVNKIRSEKEYLYLCYIAVPIDDGDYLIESKSFMNDWDFEEKYLRKILRTETICVGALHYRNSHGSRLRTIKFLIGSNH